MLNKRKLKEKLSLKMVDRDHNLNAEQALKIVNLAFRGFTLGQIGDTIELWGGWDNTVKSLIKYYK